MGLAWGCQRQKKAAKATTKAVASSHNDGMMAPMQKLLRRLLDFHARLPLLLLDFPWRETLAMLRQRFREDHLSLTASSLTFTTLTAIVPFFAVVLSIFTAFPMFGKLQQALEQWMVQNLIPSAIANPVVESVTVFASHAKQLGTAGTVFFVLTAFLLMSSINEHLNAIWRVRKQRPLGQRLLIYWAAVTIGPVVLGASIATTSYVLSLSKGWITGTPVGTPGGIQFLINTVEFALMAGGMAALYHFVPNTRVRWTHALAGGVFAAAGIALAQRLLALYLARVPSYSVVYGTFATLPILLLWVYLAWIIILLGAVIAAYLPALLHGLRRHGQGMGWQMQLAIELLRKLNHAQQTPARGLSLEVLSQQLRVEAPQLEPVLEELAELRWVGRLDEEDSPWVLLVPAEKTRLEPLIARWLLPQTPQLQPLWQHTLADMTLLDALKRETVVNTSAGAVDLAGQSGQGK
ncbi:MAG: hypothetical protein RL244_1127 [Pseudomonadota bacterium]